MRFSATSAFRRDTKGGVALMFGFVVPALIGFAGLGVDGAFWLMERNKLQTATDGAAISAAQTLNLDGDATQMRAEAQKLLTKIYGGQMTDVRFTVEYPPTSGAFAGDVNAVAINSEKDQPVYFVGLFGINATHVATRAVASVDSTAEACLLALSSDADKAVSVSGSATINLACGIAANSNAPDAVYLSGSSDTTASGVSAVGDVFQSSNAKLETNGGPVKSNSHAVDDPYGANGRNLQPPASSANCTEKNLQIHEDVVLTPGRYCGGIALTGGKAVFTPGVYIIDSGDFKANGNVQLIGTGVTFILTGKANNVASLSINGGATADLHAPKSGTSYDGILFYQAPENSGNANGNANNQNSPSNSNGKGNVINGGAGLNLSGAMYFPNESLEVSGGSASNISCLQAVAQTVKISGNTQITGKCQQSDGTEIIKRTTIELVE